MYLADGVRYASALSNSNVRAFLQDNDGLMWIATEGGLLARDNNEFISFFSTKDSLGLNPSTIWSILEDHSNRLWVGSRDGIYLLEGAFQWRQVPMKSSAMVISGLVENSKKEVFAYNARALLKYNSVTGSFLKVATLLPESSASYSAMYIDSNDTFWMCQDKEIIHFSSGTYEKNVIIDFSSPIVSSAFVADYIWMVHADGKVDVFDIRRSEVVKLPEPLTSNTKFKSATFNSVHAIKSGVAFVSMEDVIYFYNTEKEILTIDSRFSDNAISTVYEDATGNYWIGYKEAGYSFVDNSKGFTKGESLLVKDLEGQSVHNLFKDINGHVWVLSSKNNVYRLNYEKDEVEDIDITTVVDPLNPEGVTVDCLMSDNFDESRLWLLSRSRLYQCRLSGKTLKAEKSYQIPNPGSMYDVSQSSTGKVIVYGRGHSIYVLDPGAQGFRELHVSNTAASRISDMIEVSKDVMLFCGRFIDLYSINLQTSELKKEQTAVRYFAPTCLYRDSRNTFWIPVNSNGLYSYNLGNNDLEKSFFSESVYPNSIVESNGELWIGAQDGLFTYDPNTNASRKVSPASENQYNPRLAIKLDNGKLMFGRSLGLTIINPESVINASNDVAVLIPNLTTSKVRYSVYDPADKQFYLKLSPEERNITFAVSTLISKDYSDGFVYMLSGYDQSWQISKDGDSISYSRLHFGKHTFSVAFADNHGMPQGDVSTITLRIKRPFMASTGMIIVYWTLAMLILIALLSMLSDVYKERNEKNKAKMESDLLREMNNRNLDFFTNMSHEFRTPLTMILGAASMLSKQDGLDPNENKFTRLLIRNATKMQKLVDQLLDMSKVENNSVMLHVKMIEVVSKTYDMVESFRLSMESKGITLQFSSSEDNIFGWVDEDILEKSVYNLLSNALKFTPSKGTVKVGVDIVNFDSAVEKYVLAKEDRYLRITVSDTGTGIPEDKLDVIFNKYYRVGTNKQIGGSGIGLYFTKQILKIHHGDIIAETPKSSTGKVLPGTVFSFVLPLSEMSYSDEEKSAVEQPKIVNPTMPALEKSSLDSENETSLSTDSQEAASQAKKVVLAVDDDPEVLYFLKSILSPYYKFVSRFDATSGFASLGEVKPDVVISDVLMLDVDGFKFCSMIKESSEFGNIPVILLTAKTSNDDKIKGLEVKCDGYITKPFDPDFLLAFVKNLIDKKQQSQKVASNVTLASQERLDEILQKKDRQFLEDLYKLMENDLANEELDVTSVYEKMNMGRTSFYNKVKDLTGESPATLFRTYKLNRAKEILETGKYKIASVAEMTGFCSASYFSTLFKKQFGVTPKEYMADKI